MYCAMTERENMAPVAFGPAKDKRAKSRAIDAANHTHLTVRDD